jgi:type I restriction enzyme S subunit
MAEQVSIAAECRRVEESVGGLASHVRAHIERLREYRSSLISAAVTGQLDVGAPAERPRLAA